MRVILALTFVIVAPAFAQILYMPLSGPITSPFGPRSPVVGGSSYHWGLDIDGETGDSITASYEGVVTFAGWHATYGYTVVIQNGNVDFLYGHCSQLFVSPGERVATGQVIAFVGSTGVSTGSHLHFEIRIEGKPIDPLVMLRHFAPVSVSSGD
jgi:murein DD-endopeptidase MepM/ murein hydrolase activator NlpD